MASIAAGVLIGFSSFASASPPNRTPQPGDDRATAHSGNVVAADCPKLFPGSTAVPHDDIDFTGGDDTGGVDITAVPDDVTVLGVVVKGGPAYNVYANLGNLRWLGLHAPLVPSGQPAAVSHWFVCGVDKSETTTPSTPPSSSTTDTPPTDTPTSEAPTTTTGVGGEGGPTPGDSSDDVSAAAEEQDLAETGAVTGPLVALGAALLLGGGALVLLMRARGARR